MSRSKSPTATRAPYTHANGTPCWTKNCSLDNPTTDSFAGFLTWAGQPNLADRVARDEAALAKKFLPGNRIRKGGENFIRDESHHDEFERARTSMPEDEWSAVNHYMQYGYEKVNAYLRGGEAWRNFLAKDHAEKVGRWGYTDWSEAKLAQEADELVNRLDRAFKKVAQLYPAGEQHLYRYEEVPAGSNLDEIKARYQPGSTVNLPAYTSTTPNSNLIISTANKAWMQDREMIVFEIISDRGIDLHTGFGAGGGITAEEQEVLLPRGSRFKVHKIVEAPYQTGYTWQVQERLGYFGSRDNWKKPITKKRFTVIQLIDVTA